ncbi:hypothetical protein EPK99_24920 [Neorhizobium lilium]|uniref:Uncharacterized protein n=1 Tax=Neorhizobium lilium TaxID=2503024 RepID=A0A3S3RFP0_9HYPH|nr:hypothetical protein [Neorhizobium lilium]RWX74429.1 hypothetical protein EPK99_24920 [Neorhizobium lilium]
MTNLTRRQSLGLLAGATIPPTAALSAPIAAAIPVEESPELVRAYDDVVAARCELQAAQQALEWLADEWRHRWPSAPEQILGFANADRSSGNDYATAEKDIAGRFIYRDTSELTSRMPKKMRQEMPRTCFGVERPEYIRDIIELWKRPNVARTAAALARREAEQKKAIARLSEKLRLSESYFAETARLRETSGVDAVQERISAAEKAVEEALDRVSRIPALTHYGLRIKACAIGNDPDFERWLRIPGTIGELARLLDAILAISMRQSA